MKITNIRSMLLRGPRPHDLGEAGTADKLLIRVDTDCGLYGLGEAEYFMGVREGIEYIRDVAIGRNPLEIRPLWSEILYGTVPPHTPRPSKDHLWKAPYLHCGLCSPTATSTGPVVWALSGVEMALVDLAGKILGTPACNLLGGAFRDRVPIYLDRSSPDDFQDLQAWKAMAHEAAGEGFTRIKFDIDFMAPDLVRDVWNRSLSTEQLKAIVARIGAAREAEPSLEIAVDCHMQYNVPDSIRLARELAPYKIAWLEDPTPILNADACAEVRAKSPIPICIGEMFTAEQFRLFIERGACDILHPDIIFCGGMHEMHRIGELAELHYLPLAMHGNGGALATIAAAHVAAATRNFLSLEYHFIEADWIGAIVRREGLPFFRDGFVPLGDAPGLGVELDEEVCRRHLAPGEDLF